MRRLAVHGACIKASSSSTPRVCFGPIGSGFTDVSIWFDLEGLCVGPINSGAQARVPKVAPMPAKEPPRHLSELVFFVGDSSGAAFHLALI